MAIWLSKDPSAIHSVLAACPHKSCMREMIAHFRRQKDTTPTHKQMIEWIQNKDRDTRKSLKDTRLCIECASDDVICDAGHLIDTFKQFLQRMITIDLEQSSISSVVKVLTQELACCGVQPTKRPKTTKQVAKRLKQELIKAYGQSIQEYVDVNDGTEDEQRNGDQRLLVFKCAYYCTIPY